MKHFANGLMGAVFAAGVAGMVFAEENPSSLEEHATPSRWRFSIGARLAPGLKTRAGVSSAAVINAAGSGGGAETTSHGSSSSSSGSSESMPMPSRLDFPDGSFIDMNDAAGNPGTTMNWHFNDASMFNESSGTITMSSGQSTSISSANSSKSFSKTVSPDVTSSRESDLWGGDIEIGYDMYIGERFSLGLALGVTFYRCDDAIRMAGRCGQTTSSSTVSESTSTAFEAMTFTDPNLAYDGALADIMNDDGSIGAGTADGRTNPYGGNNPMLTLSDGNVMRTTSLQTMEQSTTKSLRRTFDVTANGDVETRELRLALQPAWKATDWLELRGSLGATATRVSVDVDTTIFVNGKTWDTISGGDDDWIVMGLCGIDMIVSPLDKLSIFVGADLRLGNNKMDYEAGLANGEVELARATYRAGLAVRF